MPKRKRRDTHRTLRAPRHLLTLRELYGTPLGKKVVNVVGAATFEVIQRTLQEAMAMGAARLLEKPKTGPHDNMPLELLIRSDQDENGAFNARLELLKNQYADILKIRNKMFAHRDRDTHTEYVNLKWGQGGTGNNATFMERTDLFVLASLIHQNIQVYRSALAGARLKH